VNLFRGFLDDFIVEAELSLHPRRCLSGGGGRTRRARLRLAASSASHLAPLGPLLSATPPPLVSPVTLDALESSLLSWIPRAADLPSWDARRYASPTAVVIRIVSDASDRFWGALVWLPSGRHVLLWGRFSDPDSRAASGFRELIPLRHVLTYIQEHDLVPSLVGARVSHWLDAKVTESYLSRWSSPDPAVVLELQSVWSLMCSLQLVYEVVWCSRERGWVPLSDLISKASFAPLPEYFLPSALFDAVLDMLEFRPSVDLFASTATTRLPCFCARSLSGVSPESIGRLASRLASSTAPDDPSGPSASPSGAEQPRLDSLPEHTPDLGWQGSAWDLPWYGRRLYAFPPWSQLSRLAHTWSSVPSGGSTSLLLIVPTSLRSFVAHPDVAMVLDLTSRFPSLRLAKEDGSLCRDPPPWGGTSAVLLRR
jgi:hypothetical protein